MVNMVSRNFFKLWRCEPLGKFGVTSFWCLQSGDDICVVRHLRCALVICRHSQNFIDIPHYHTNRHCKQRREFAGWFKDPEMRKRLDTIETT